ncbi:MAG: hypothetical protein ABW185_02105 [Sedimenticola sp.]
MPLRISVAELEDILYRHIIDTFRDIHVQFLGMERAALFTAVTIVNTLVARARSRAAIIVGQHSRSTQTERDAETVATQTGDAIERPSMAVRPLIMNNGRPDVRMPPPRSMHFLQRH